MMDLSKPSKENMSYMIEQITNKLKMVNVEVMNADHISLSKYDDLRDMYELVMKRHSITPNEMQAIATELGTLRN